MSVQKVHSLSLQDAENQLLKRSNSVGVGISITCYARNVHQTRRPASPRYRAKCVNRTPQHPYSTNCLYDEKQQSLAAKVDLIVFIVVVLHSRVGFEFCRTRNVNCVGYNLATMYVTFGVQARLEMGHCPHVWDGGNRANAIADRQVVQRIN